MSFLRLIEHVEGMDFDARLGEVTGHDVLSVLQKPALNEQDFLTLLAPAAAEHLEAIAQRAHALTLQHFGRSILLFAPLYISNVCTSHCTYCGFAATNKIRRKHLRVPEIEEEAKRLSETGIRQILLLTGDARKKASPTYLAEAIRTIKPHFSSIGLEVYAMDTEEYADMCEAGADMLTIYQETYDRVAYPRLHPGGPKADYEYRLDAPERACEAGMRSVAVGSLLGLSEPRRDAFITGLHAAYLQQHYPDVEVSASMPRIRPFEGGAFSDSYAVSDRLFVQFMTALRIFIPRLGITISTRESQSFRDRLLPLGVTRMSAGVSTAVGDATEDPSSSQFEIEDTRSVPVMCHDLQRAGYQPVLHDWNHHYLTKKGSDPCLHPTTSNKP